jgi:hypothetical protein
VFGLFAPQCPIGTWEKTWTESRMCWLAERLGIDRLLDADVLVPTAECFPLPYRGTEEDVRRVLDWLCGAMGVKPERLALEICPDTKPGRPTEMSAGAVGQYEYGEQQALIRVKESQLADPQKLAATLAHELGHELLIGGRLLTAEVPDHEDFTDLLPVFLGAGVFAANSTLEEDYYDTGTWSTWRIGKQGYLPARVFGYAFALFAFVRGEERPSWAEHLRLDAADPFWKGLRYLYRTDDSLFHPDRTSSERRPLGPEEAVSRLRTGTPTVRLRTLWDLRENPQTRDDVIAAVAGALRDRDPDLPAEAARTLAVFGDAAASTVPALVAELPADNPATRAGAAYALGALQLSPGVVVPELSALLPEKNRAVLEAAAEALYHFGMAAEPAGPRLVAALTNALKDCDYGMIELLAATLVATSPDPRRVVRECMEEIDEELGGWALEAVEEAIAPSPPAG